MRLKDIKLGQTIRTTNDGGLAPWIRGYTGVVTKIDIRGYDIVSIEIQFSSVIMGRNEWSFMAREEFFDAAMTPEEQAAFDDQERRKAHADKYL